jgi:shikimate kinase
MSAPVCGGYALSIEGNLVSKPYVDMTIDIMKAFSGIVEHDGAAHVYHVVPMQYDTREYAVEGDYSSAGYFFALAALSKQTITVKNVRRNSLQPDKKILDVFERMGAHIERTENEVTITGAGIIPLTIDMLEFPDQAQTLAVTAAFAQGVTVLTNVQSLRVKETERVKAIENELAKMGIKTESTHDALTIYGGAPHRARISTYGDHRMAMSFSVAGAVLNDMEIEEPSVVEKTFPTFFECMQGVGLESTLALPKNIVLIGMRGAGKTTIGKKIAEHFGVAFADTDSVLVERNGITIPDMVRAHGWDYFRDKETEVVIAEAEQGGRVLATGGGAVLRPQNVAALRRTGITILLTAPVQTLVERIQGDSNRVALTNEATLADELTVVLEQRKDVYKASADYVVDTTGKTEPQVVSEILQLLTPHL